MVLLLRNWQLGALSVPHLVCWDQFGLPRQVAPVSHLLLALVLAQVDWMEQRMPYYPPTVNDPEAYKFAIDVAGRWVERSWVVGEQK